MGNTSLDRAGALREKARDKTRAVRPASSAPSVSAFDPRQSGQLSPEQVRGLETIHKNCGLRLAEALKALLSTTLDFNLLSIEQTSCADFLERVAEPSYLLSFRSVAGAYAAVQIEFSLLFPFLDLILGGSGTEAVEPHDLTEIEEELLQPVRHAIARALQEGWQPLLKTGMVFDRRFQKSEAGTIFSSGDRLLLASFEVEWQEKKGKVLLALSPVIAGGLLRALAPQNVASLPPVPQDRGHLQEELLESRFAAELFLPRSTISVRQLHELRPGNVVTLKVRSNELLPLHIAGQAMFLTTPARCGAKRGAQIQKILTIVPENEEKKKND
jgi:flagellar motor switch protein FliM